jgi:hypothetical protein
MRTVEHKYRRSARLAVVSVDGLCFRFDLERRILESLEQLMDLEVFDPQPKNG